jgi:hypothetical protein
MCVITEFGDEISIQRVSEIDAGPSARLNANVARCAPGACQLVVSGFEAHVTRKHEGEAI